jgi:hypothetical protein
MRNHEYIFMKMNIYIHTFIHFSGELFESPSKFVERLLRLFGLSTAGPALPASLLLRYVFVCECVCVCVRERKRERARECVYRLYMQLLITCNYLTCSHIYTDCCLWVASPRIKYNTMYAV